MYKGVVKVTYDRGYATQTKSLLLESTTTASETVAQLIEGLGLRGMPSDYALEEEELENWRYTVHTYSTCVHTCTVHTGMCAH